MNCYMFQCQVNIKCVIFINFMTVPLNVQNAEMLKCYVCCIKTKSLELKVNG